MAETNMQQETGGRFASPLHGVEHPAHRAAPPNVTLAPIAGDRPPASTAGIALTLALPPGNGPVFAQDFAAFLAQALPAARLNVRSGPDWAQMLPGPVVVLTADPVRSLAWRIQQGMAPDRALAEWKEAAEALLGLHRRDRRRIIPVDPAILDPDMAPARELLTARLLKLPTAPALVPPSGTGLPDEAGTPATTAIDPEATTLALVMLDDPAVAELAEELRAVTLGIGKGCDRQGLALAAWKRATVTRTRAGLLGDQLRLQIERGEGELQKLQERAELLATRLEEQVTTNQSLGKAHKADQQKFAQALADRDHQIAAAHQANTETVGRLQKLQEQAELLAARLEEQVKANQSLGKTHKADQQKFAQALADRERQIADAHQTNAQTAARLERLQQKSELQSDTLALQGSLRKDLSDRNATLEKRVTELEAALAAEQARGRREREQLTAQKAALELRRTHAQRRIEAMLASRSWRLTKPVRAIARLVPGRG
ncbi:hypothetical protein [Paracoccus sp. MC1862]|nr:hypothetical protein [Paracoccus sp. MC1862]QQO44884.1 hypothetical protein JGR78_00130 [Paracoccus sp. MC1862]